MYVYCIFMLYQPQLNPLLSHYFLMEETGSTSKHIDTVYMLYTKLYTSCRYAFDRLVSYS